AAHDEDRDQRSGHEPQRKAGPIDEALVEQRLHQRGEQRLGGRGDDHRDERDDEARTVRSRVAEQAPIDRQARAEVARSRRPVRRRRRLARGVGLARGAQYSTSAASGRSFERIAPIRSSYGRTRQLGPSSTSQAASRLPYSTTTGIAGTSASAATNGSIAPRSAPPSAARDPSRMRRRLPNSWRARSRSSSRSATMRCPPL